MNAWLQHFRLFLPAVPGQWVAFQAAPSPPPRPTERCELRRKSKRRRVLSSEKDVDRTTDGEDLFLALIRGGVVVPPPAPLLRPPCARGTGEGPVLPCSRATVRSAECQHSASD